MQYISTRGQVKGLSFEDAVMMGLADDGGLLVPHDFPDVHSTMSQWRDCTFQELCYEILVLFIGDEISKADLQQLINRSYTNFTHPEITPVVSIGKRYVLELFHGPTFAFKDVALQLLGNLFEYFLVGRGHRLTVLGATSGDTGSAAIYGLRGKKNVDVFMLHPKGRVSPVQERQMTTVLDSNIHNLAVEGSFDDAQSIVKALFNDLPFKQKYCLGAVNSINWARILTQIVYYFSAYFQVTKKDSEKVNFSVPTGNFGDILAGYYAKKMGLPIDQLMVATNRNDILYRFFRQGQYHLETVHPTWSPSMDIQISSNFERFLFDISGQSSEQLVSWMSSFHKTGKLTLEGSFLKRAQQEMQAERASEEETLATISHIYQDYGYILDPHTAVGVTAAIKANIPEPVICLGTAHPAKFSEAVQTAIGKAPALPEVLANLEQQPTRCHVLPARAESVQNYILDTLQQ
ncbi:threonine synthase [Deltaproteobacteria bacterium TL4]